MAVNQLKVRSDPKEGRRNHGRSETKTDNVHFHCRVGTEVEATREIMRERKIDYLVMQNSEEFLGGTVRWFTDFSARYNSP